MGFSLLLLFQFTYVHSIEGNKKKTAMFDRKLTVCLLHSILPSNIFSTLRTNTIYYFIGFRKTFKDKIYLFKPDQSIFRNKGMYTIKVCCFK